MSGLIECPVRPSAIGIGNSRDSESISAHPSGVDVSVMLCLSPPQSCTNPNNTSVFRGHTFLWYPWCEEMFPHMSTGNTQEPSALPVNDSFLKYLDTSGRKFRCLHFLERVPTFTLPDPIQIDYLPKAPLPDTLETSPSTNESCEKRTLIHQWKELLVNLFHWPNICMLHALKVSAWLFSCVLLFPALCVSPLMFIPKPQECSTPHPLHVAFSDAYNKT